MKEPRESVKGWLGWAGAAAILLLVASCSSAFHQVPPLQSGGSEGIAGPDVDLDQMVCPATVWPCANIIRPPNAYGYLIQKVDDTTYKVFFEAKLKPTYALTEPQRNTEAEIYLNVTFDLATYRAALLAQENGAPAFDITDRSNFLHVLVKNNTFTDPTVYRACVERCAASNNIECTCVPVYYDYATLGLPAGLGTYGHYDFIDLRVLLTIQFDKNSKPGSYVTQEALAKLQQKYPSIAETAGQQAPEPGSPAAETPAAAPAEQPAPAPALEPETPAVAPPPVKAPPPGK